MLSEAEYMQDLESNVFQELGDTVARFEGTGNVKQLVSFLRDIVSIYDVTYKIVVDGAHGEDGAYGAALQGLLNNIRILKPETASEGVDSSSVDSDEVMYRRIRESMQRAYETRGFGSVMWSIHEISRLVRSIKHPYGQGFHELVMGRVDFALHELERTNYSPRVGK